MVHAQVPSSQDGVGAKAKKASFHSLDTLPDGANQSSDLSQRVRTAHAYWMSHIACRMLHIACCMLRLGFRSLCRAAAVVHSGALLDSVPEQPGPSCPPTHITRYYSTHGCSGRDGVWRHCKIRTLSAACPCYGNASGTVSLPCCTATESPNAPQVYDGSPSELKAFWRSSMSAPRRACPILPCPAAPVQHLL